MGKVIYGGIEVDQSITLTPSPVDTDVPYCFFGKNLNSYVVKIRPAPGCGCTTATGEFSVEAGEEFQVSGIYKKSQKQGIYTKVVNLWFASGEELTNSEDRKITVSFTGRIV